MTEREFCYWLQGLFEVGKPEALNAEQTEMIRKHLALVFTNVTKPVAPIGLPYANPFPLPGTASDLEAQRRHLQGIGISGGRISCAPNSAAGVYC